MRVLHLSTETTWRGGEQQILYLHISLLANGIESAIACQRGSEMHQRLEDMNLECFTLPFRSAYDSKTVRAITTLCRQHTIDILHMHTAKGHTLGVLAGLMGLRVPMILARRVDFAVKKNWFSRFKYNYGQIQRIVCVSDAILEIMRPDIKEPGKLMTIHSGIQLDKFKQADPHFLRKTYDFDKDTTLIGNTSALADHKDYFTFVNTAEIVLGTHPHVHFFIAGDGPMRSAITAYIVEKGLEDQITLLGFVKNIGDVLASLDIFLFTSRTEGLGTSGLDALSLGKPVIGTRAGGIPEYVHHGENGFLAPVGDADTLATHITALIDDKQLYRKLSMNAKEHVKAFSIERLVTKTISLYEEVNALS